MLESIRKNNIPTLEKRKAIINNDIDLDELNYGSVMLFIALPSLFLLSLQMMMTTGTI